MLVTYKCSFYPSRLVYLQNSVLPVLSGWVLVLLKLLLATVSAATAAQPTSAAGTGFPPGMPNFFSWTAYLFIDLSVEVAPEQPPAPPPTLDEIDVTRHREITSKAVSAILLLTLKWFKVSRKCFTEFSSLGRGSLPASRRHEVSPSRATAA
jgi:hypothetical protein